jgi:hypothetical protein
MNVIAAIAVSAGVGDDTVAARYGFPFKTLGAAKTAAQSGDTIYVSDGVFNERDLLKNGVNWYFMAGTKVDYLPSRSSGLDRAIFDDSAGGVTCRIEGAGEFIWEGENTDLTTSGGICGGVIWLQNSASNVSFRAYRATLGPAANIGQDTHTVFLENCAQFYASLEILENSAGPGGPFTWFDGNFNLYAKIIRASSSSYSVWAKEPAGGSTKNGYIESDLIDNPSYGAVRLESGVANSQFKLWIRAKEIRGRSGGASMAAIQQSGGKLYIEAEKIDNTSLGAANAFIRQSPAVFVTGGNAWIRAQKITTNLNADLTALYTGQAVTANASTDKITLNAHGLNFFQQVRFGGTTVPGGLTAGTWYWVVNPTTNNFQVSSTFSGSAIDLTSAGSGVTIDTIPWAMFATITGGEAFIDCPHFERVGNYAGNGISIAGGTLNLRGQIMSKIYNGRGIVHSAGAGRIAGLILDTTETNNANSRPVEISSSGLILEQCKLVAPDLADSIYAATAKTLTCYGVKANRAKNANVTANVDFAVDANTV